MDGTSNLEPSGKVSSSFEIILPLPVEGIQRLNDFRWLNNCALQLLSLTEPDEIYSFAAKNLQEKLGECFIVALEYLPEGDKLRWKAIHGVSLQNWETALKIIGYDLSNITFEVTSDFQAAYQGNHLYHYKGDFTSLANFVFPKHIAQSLDKLLNIQHIYSISFKGQKSTLGLMHIFDRHPRRRLDATLIETFTYQCALALERAIATAQIQQNLKKLSRTETVAKLGHWEFDLNTKTVFVSEGARSIFGLESRTYSIPEVQKIPLPQYRQMLDQALTELIRHQKPYDVRFKIQRPTDGKIVDIHSIAEYDPKRHTVFGIIQDISEQVKDEEELRTSEERYHRISEITSDIIYAYQRTPQGEISLSWISGAVELICGYTIDEITEKGGWEFLVLEEDLPIYQENVLNLSPGSSALSELRLRRKNNSTVWVLSLAQCITEEIGSSSHWIYGGLVNITYRKQSEEALRQAQKFAAIGTLAAGVAHEMNTPLQVITGVADSLINSINKGEIIPNEHLLNNLEMVSRNAWRIAYIVRALDIYARPNIKRGQPQDLNELVNQISLLATMKLPDEEKISIILKLEPNLPHIICDSNDITEMLVHLLTNARDAMPNGGKIIIRTHYDQNTNEVSISVKDSGIGIPYSIQKKVFDPFFTTKELGKGTGLGLPVIQGIIRSYGGRVELSSVPGKGTTVTL